MPHRRKDILEEKCCEDPQVGTNADHARAVAKQCREIRETRKNDYASTEGKDIRWGVQLPIWMYNALNNYEQKHGRKLINGKDDINWLAREYPQFRIPKEI